MTKRLQMGKDINGLPTYDQPFSDVTFAFTLTANTAADITVPANAQTALFSFTAGDDVWVSYNAAAVLPTATNYFLLEGSTTTFLLLESGGSNFLLLENFSAAPTAGGLSLNPERRFVTAGAVLSFISTAAANVNVQFYTKTFPPLGQGSY